MVRHLAALLAVAVVGLAAGCSPSGTPSADTSGPIVLGGVFDLSATASTLGKPAQQGAQLAVDEINGRGGVLGRTLELGSADEGCDTSKGVAATRKYMSERAFMLFGFSCSPVALAVKPLAEAQHIPMLVTTATATAISRPPAHYVFDSNVSAADEAKSVANLVLPRFKPHKVAVAYVGNDYGKSAADGVKAVLEAKGLGSGYQGVEIPLDATDYRAQSLILARSRPDVILVVAYSTPPLIKALKQAGVTAPVVSFSGGVLAATVTPLAQQGLLNGFVSSWYAPTELSTTSTSKAMSDFVQAYHRRYGQYPDSTALQGYQGIKLVQKALEKAGAVDADKFVNAMESFETVDFSLGMPMGFSATDHSGADRMSLVQFESNEAPGGKGLYGSVKIFSAPAGS
ncbi:ABC transporter substrate-binding protein [Streptomyces sp. NPDC005231]|uniref:ABC transporter substrate-binding protein n=1 Tax=Streptomyces sp. NPDC005231 TaxID=3157026 RepID=UPI0033B50D73